LRAVHVLGKVPGSFQLCVERTRKMYVVIWKSLNYVTLLIWIVEHWRGC